MAVMAPELVGAAGDIGSGAAAGSVGGLGARGGGDDLGGFRDEGSPAAFMIAIVLIGLAMIGFYFAFHNPSEWDLASGQYPGLFGRVTNWMQQAAGTGSNTPPQPPTAESAGQNAAASVVGPIEAAVGAAALSEAEKLYGGVKNIPDAVFNALKTGFGLW